jgi:release factor glutamine methyltransferase
MINKRKTGFPLPYLLGEWEFYGHPFFVDPSVLIPRPETEMLVEEASGWLKRHPSVHMGFDIGTGSGCIAVSLLLEKPYLSMTAVDLHRNALMTACRNAARHNVRDRFCPVQSSLFSAFSQNVSLVIANLPYIPSRTCREIEPSRFEPLSALDGGDDGFDLYRLLFQQLSNKMNRECLILCEIEYRQRDLALMTAAEYFPDNRIDVLDDLAGLPRILRIDHNE